jgi:hypothetical protein
MASLMAIVLALFTPEALAFIQIGFERYSDGDLAGR